MCVFCVRARRTCYETSNVRVLLKGMWMLPTCISCGQIREVMREVMAEVDTKENLAKVGEAKLKAGNDLALTAKAVTE